MSKKIRALEQEVRAQSKPSAHPAPNETLVARLVSTAPAGGVVTFEALIIDGKPAVRFISKVENGPEDTQVSFDRELCRDAADTAAKIHDMMMALVDRLPE